MGETFDTVERRPDKVALVRLGRPRANARRGLEPFRENGPGQATIVGR